MKRKAFYILVLAMILMSGCPMSETANNANTNAIRTPTYSGNTTANNYADTSNKTQTNSPTTNTNSSKSSDNRDKSIPKPTATATPIAEKTEKKDVLLKVAEEHINWSYADKTEIVANIGLTKYQLHWR